MSDERAAHTGEAISREAVQHVINQHFLRGSERDFARWEKARDAIAALPALAPPADVERLVDEFEDTVREELVTVHEHDAVAWSQAKHAKAAARTALLAACRPGMPAAVPPPYDTETERARRGYDDPIRLEAWHQALNHAIYTPNELTDADRNAMREIRKSFPACRPGRDE